MKIHTDVLTNRDLIDASLIARVEFDKWRDRGSRIRDHAFEVTLFGESRRRPNNRGRFDADQYAATWDQWGVFLAVLFDRDPHMFTPYYADADHFHRATGERFRVEGYWPADAHGDHRFTFTGTPYENACTKCSAVRRWEPYVTQSA